MVGPGRRERERRPRRRVEQPGNEPPETVDRRQRGGADFHHEHPAGFVANPAKILRRLLPPVRFPPAPVVHAHRHVRLDPLGRILAVVGERARGDVDPRAVERRDAVAPHLVNVLPRVALVHRHVEPQARMVAVALDDVHGTRFEQLDVLRILRARQHPVTPVKAIAEQQAAAVAGVEKRLGRIGDVLEIDEVQIGLGEIANLGVHPRGVPIEQDLRLDVAALAEDPTAVDDEPQTVLAVERVEFLGDLPHAERDVLDVRDTSAGLERQREVVQILRPVVARPPQARIADHRPRAVVR